MKQKGRHEKEGRRTEKEEGEKLQNKEEELKKSHEGQKVKS